MACCRGGTGARTCRAVLGSFCSRARLGAVLRVWGPSNGRVRPRCIEWHERARCCCGHFVHFCIAGVGDGGVVLRAHALARHAWAHANACGGRIPCEEGLPKSGARRERVDARARMGWRSAVGGKGACTPVSVGCWPGARRRRGAPRVSHRGRLTLPSRACRPRARGLALRKRTGPRRGGG